MITQITRLLDASQTRKARAFVEQAEFVEGKATNRGSNIKNNEQISENDSDQSEIGRIVVQALLNNDDVLNTAFPRGVPSPTFSRYQPGMYYGLHMDEAIMNTKPKPLRTDLSVTVFLSSGDEYDGGELELWTGTEPQLVKLDAGDAVIYPTGLIHQVRPVTRGTRYAAVTWIQSQIPELKHRQVLSHYYQLVARMGHKADETDRLLMESVRTGLYRMWMEL
ncbi:Fe2+-dependent dioxygenase [Salinisphaera hydrothermalis]|uniref:Fe(II)-dependent oxygenase superfamily protein n=1 Tax=Salinisphaera hydrothermalis (strain C41B8) TaxID=1304275 RepID=A0A084IJF3_SALHC|nr:Fe2+-dependent dioxygenase [Salinisphaera hydrothermalis]KEZ76837.1 Fe(II)-dependent oxygenase superfamily protein [Salinisphaera hydrothermalis C41B8]